jgi:SOS-response transcriptional repressor LexA
MHNEKLTKRQAEVLNVIINYIEDRGYAPSFREVGELLNLASSSTVFSHLETLKKKGYLTWEPSQSRTLRILKTAS